MLEQYTQPIPKVDALVKPTADHGSDILQLQQQVLRLRETVELQNRQIRRLESALQLVESHLNRR